MVYFSLLFENANKEGDKMRFFSRWFQKKAKNKTSINHSSIDSVNLLSKYQKVPPYVLVTDEEEKRRVALIASAIAAGNYPDSQFVVKHIYQVNPKIKTISVIAASLAAEKYPTSKWCIKAIYQKIDEV